MTNHLISFCEKVQVQLRRDRVQNLSTKDYTFRHHLETNVDGKAELKNLARKRINTINKLKGIVKVRINQIGQIVATGEY